jgi:hypothetical protein
MKTKERIDEMYAAFESDKRNDGDMFYKLKSGSPEWMTDVIHAVHGDKLPDDTVYEMIYDALSRLSEIDDDSEDETVKDLDRLFDAIYEMEPDVYTSNLTAWLNKRADHVYYLTEALEQMDIKDGFQALSAAQKIQMDEIGSALVQELINLD